MTTQQDHQRVVDSTAATAASMKMQNVPVNTYEANGAFVVVAPLPAVTSDDVTVELDGGTLRLMAELRSSGPREYLIQEWEYGGYERELDVPEGFGAGLEASLANGQIAIRVIRGDFKEKIQIHPTAE